ncbi:alpha/beta hydrolase [Ruminococcus gauvreauii]|uniref:Alpha/beta hydrolase-fold protein n=1 Tax=Ruminococcus gauvreauii TaxID=438033 RepID=A0ABY5VH42_9FIRM|nr:alpha/beta hydrolase-fold protein [Ruminococcus gauvreauii]UWP59850.1 alpha/beta hydrolase-fold protein [Ruminococcus gauvreauii]
MKKKYMQKWQFEISGKTVTVYPSKTPDCPIVYLNTFGDEGEKVYLLLQQNQCPDFTFVTVGGLAWDRDMAPWDIPPVSKFDTPCTGGASEYLKLLAGEIVPKAEETATGKIIWRGLAGYSLGGLFAVYALYHTGAFSRIASVSGSLWYPGLMDYVRKQEPKVRPNHIYFSLGSKESYTRNPILKTVQENTETLKRLYEKAGIDTVFDLNPGGHYRNAAGRTAAGISWILSRSSTSMEEIK